MQLFRKPVPFTFVPKNWWRKKNCGTLTVYPLPTCPLHFSSTFGTCWPCLTRLDGWLDVQEILEHKASQSENKQPAREAQMNALAFMETLWKHGNTAVWTIIRHKRTHRREAQEIRLHGAACFHRDYACVFTLIQMDNFPCAAIFHSNVPTHSHA